MSAPAGRLLDQFYAALVEERASLWHDLYAALRAASNGIWSVGVEDYAHRLLRNARLVGPTGVDAVPWPLVAGGVYEAVLRAGGLEPTLPDEQELTRLDELMTGHGGTVEQHRDRWAPTVARIQREDWSQGEDE